MGVLGVLGGVYANGLLELCNFPWYTTGNFTVRVTLVKLNTPKSPKTPIFSTGYGTLMWKLEIGRREPPNGGFQSRTPKVGSIHAVRGDFIRRLPVTYTPLRLP